MPKAVAIEKITYRRPAANPSTATRLEPGDRVVITFNQPIRNTAGQNVEVLIDFDINASGGTRGDCIGEKSLMGATNPNTNGFVTFPNEPIFEMGATFTNVPSGYTTRHEFTYAGVVGLATVPINTPFYTTFSELPSSLYGYQTIWGVAVEGDLNAALTAPP